MPTLRRTDRGWSKANNRARNVSETFAYDSLNRLTRVSGGSSQTLTYDRRGNIKSKTGVGTYAYSTTSNRLTSVTNSGVTTAYTHDANGNITAGDGRTMKYTGFDKPHSIVKGTDTVRFAYDGDRSRYKRTVNGTVTWYVGNVEITDLGESRMEYRRHVEGGAVVRVTRTANAEGKATSRTQQVNYRVTDHLGSVTALLDSSGGLVHDLSYDPWGERRKPDTPLSAIESPATALMAAIAITPRGFTGHEMLDAVGLIHMNGRVYDPKLGRFLSADPFVQDANDPQLLNRYAYVRNNPLNATDPSGYIFDWIKGAIGAIVGFVSGLLSNALDIPELNRIAGALTCRFGGRSMCAGFAFGSTLGSGGSLGDALLAGVDAYLNSNSLSSSGPGGETSHVMYFQSPDTAGSDSGSVLPVLSDEFGHGFTSAGMASSLDLRGFTRGDGEGGSWSTILRIIGATSSLPTGGKYANGAATRSFGQAHGGSSQHKDVVKGGPQIDGVTRTEVENGVLHVRDSDGASVLVQNDVLEYGIPKVGSRQISSALNVSKEADLRRVQIIGGYRAKGHPNFKPTSAHSDKGYKYGAIDVRITGIESSEAVARLLYKSGQFTRVAWYNDGRTSAHADFKPSGHAYFKGSLPDLVWERVDPPL